MWSLLFGSALAATPAEPVDDGRAVLAWALGDAWVAQNGIVTPEVVERFERRLADARVSADVHIAPAAVQITTSGAVRVDVQGAARVAAAVPVADARVSVAVHRDDNQLSTQVQGHIGATVDGVAGLVQPWSLSAQLPLGEVASSFELSLARGDGWTLTARTHTAPASHHTTATPLLAAELDGRPITLQAGLPGSPGRVVVGWVVAGVRAVTGRLVPTLIVG